MSRAGRALLGTVLGYTVIGVSIITAVTSSNADTALDVTVQSVGLFYQNAVGTLERFAVSTTVPSFLFEVAYVTIGLVAMWCAGFVFWYKFGEWLSTDKTSDEITDNFSLELKLMTLTVCVIGGISLYFAAGAQLLVLGVILVVTEAATLFL